MGMRQLGTIALFTWISVLFFMCRDETPSCATGHKIECECPNNAVGVQTCAENGTYGTCKCGSANSDADADSDFSTNDDTENNAACEDDVEDIYTCIDCYCVEEIDLCNDTPACLDLADCLMDCVDVDCQNACASQYEDGVSVLIDFLECRDDNCDVYMGGDGDSDSDTDGDSDSDTDGDADCANTVTDLDTCIDCYCGDVFAACGANADCVDLISCLSGCTDDACADDCATQFPDGIDPFNEIVDCLDADCGEYLSEPDCAADVSDFDTCLDCYCDTALNECDANAYCMDLAECIFDCADSACQQTCIDNYPDGVDTLTAVYDCRDENCLSYMNDPTECADAVTDFDTCLSCYCEGYVTACSNNADCISLLTCLNECDTNDTDCINACASEYPDGINDYNDVIDCLNESCSDYF